MSRITDGAIDPTTLFGRLDWNAATTRCEGPDPSFFVPLDGRLLVAFGAAPDDDALARLAAVSTVRWMYRQLGLAEVDGADAGALATVPGVVGAAPAWQTVGAMRPFVVGLNAICTFAARQVDDAHAFFQHAPDAGYPVFRAEGEGQLLDVDTSLRLPTPPALLPVVNLSVGTLSVPFPTELSDIVNLATGAASNHVLVVVAAGNCGATAGDSMSAWARPDWVLSVGATEDAAGTTIAAYSSRGEPGPDLVAHGASRLNPAKRGTSFAAPRVTFLARLVVAAFCELGREVMVAQGQPPMGVPAVGYGIVDDFGAQIWRAFPDDEATGWMALPLVGVRVDVVQELVAVAGESLRVATTPAIVRDVLLSAARPVPGATAAEAGAGFVDSDLVVARLAALTVADLWTWFGEGPVPDAVAHLHPFDVDGLHLLAYAVERTGPSVKFDYKTECWAPLPVVDEELRRQHPQGLPVDLTGIRL